jgi:hypothetical protein
MNNLLKKVAVSVSTVATVASMGLMPMVAKAAAPGEVYKTPDGTVWFITTDMQKRPFTSAGAFLSYGFLSFSQVKDADASVTALPTGSFIAPADGKIFCASETKGSDVKGECSLVTGGMKAAFTSAAVFTGQGFSFSRAINGDSSFLSKTSNIDSSSAGHLPGVLVNNSGTVQMVVSGGLWGVPSMDVFNSWGYSFSDVVPANTADKALAQVGVIPARQAGQLVPTGTTTPNPTGAYTASVSNDSPAASTLVTTQSTADLAHFTVMGSGTVTSMKFKRIGVSEDATLPNSYLFEGMNRITDAASVASGYITFTGLNWTVSGARSIAVKSNISGSSSGQTVGVQLVAINGVDLTVMPSAAIHTIASATLAGVALTSTVTVSGNTNPGTDILLWQNTATVSTRDVTMNRLSLRQVGSINSADINNFRLFIDGVQVASQASLDSSGYITFNFSKTLMTGSRTIKVIGDVIGGSGRTVSMSLRGAYDLGVVDSQYNAGIVSTVTAGAFPNTASAFTVASGTMTVVKTSDSQSTALTLGASDQSFGKWTFTAYGEPTKVETLSVGIDFTDGGAANAASTFRNGRVLVNGSQVGSTTNITEAGVSFTTNFTVNPGTPAIVEVRADVFDIDGTGTLDTSDTAKAQILIGSSNGVPQVSLTPINVPIATVDANTLAISTGALSLSKEATYANRNVVVPANAYKIAAFNMTNGNVEDINVNTFTLTYTCGVGGTFCYQDLNNVYVKYGASTTQIKPTLGNNDAFSVSFTAAKNSVTTVEVYADISSAAVTANDTLIVNLAVTATSASGQTANVGATAGQTLTAKTGGTITQVLGGSTPAAKIVSDNQTIDTQTVEFTAVDDSYVITDVTVTVGAATAVQSVILKDGATVLGTKPGATSVTFSGLNIPVATGTATKILTVAVQLGTVGVGAGSTGDDIHTTMTTVTARSNATGTSATVSGGTATGKAMYVYASVPTLSRAALPTSALTTGTVTLGKFSVTSDGGSVDINKFLFAVTKSAGATKPAITSPTLWDADTNLQIAPTVTTLAATDASGSISLALTTPETISGTRNYVLKASVAATLASGDNINTTLASSGLGFVASTTAGAVGATAGIVWSDRSASSHGTGTSDWTNDYLVKYLSLDSWTLTFN